MRLRLPVVLVLTVAATAVEAQTIEITPLAGFRFGGGNVNTNPQGDFEAGANFELDDTAAFGLHLGYRVGAAEIEILYARQSTELQSEALFAGVPVFALAVETWQLGGSYFLREEDARLAPYVGAGLGLTRLLPKPANLVDETRFSVSLAAGARLGLGSHFGLRLEARGLFTVLGGDNGSFCSRGACGPGTSQLMSQVDLRAGLILRL
jgi:Outer membrane protein beta-barrel domain